MFFLFDYSSSSRALCLAKAVGGGRKKYVFGGVRLFFFSSLSRTIGKYQIPKKVLGVCQFARFNDPMDQKPKKLNQPHVRRSGGKGIKSRLLHASVCSCLASLPLRRRAWGREVMRCFRGIFLCWSFFFQFHVRFNLL